MLFVYGTGKAAKIHSMNDPKVSIVLFVGIDGTKQLMSHLESIR